MSDEVTPLERYTALGAGLPLLLIALSLFAWGVGLALAGLRGDAGWPPGLEKLLLPIALTSAAVGFGAWRLLRMGLPAQIGGYSLGRVILAGFGVAAVIGAVL